MDKGLTVSKKLEAKLKKTDLEVRNFITALHKKIVKLQKENGELEVENMSLHDRINSFPAEFKEYLEFKKSFGKLSDKELKELASMRK